PVLADAGHEVHATSRGAQPECGTSAVTWHEVDLLDPRGMAKMVEQIRPELLVHLAWYAEHGRFWTASENVQWAEASLALLRAFVVCGGRRAVMVGTCAEYDWAALAAPHSSTGKYTDAASVIRCHEQDTPLAPDTLYGVSKHATHMVAQSYAEQIGLELAWARIFFLYGPGE